MESTKQVCFEVTSKQMESHVLYSRVNYDTASKNQPLGHNGLVSIT